MPDFSATESYRLGGGLNLADSPEAIGDEEASELVNLRFTGQARWTTRAAARTLSIFTNPCGIFPFPHGADTADGSPNGAVVLNWTGTAVDLWVVDGQGLSAAHVGTLAGWEAVGVRPKVTAATLRECLWIVDEGKLYGLTVYDPLERFERGKLFQPVFKFDRSLTTPPAVVKARCVKEFSNFLFVGGYGTEADPDRPEFMRFSYLGLEQDTGGAGDAGEQDNPAFDDQQPISPANQPFIPLPGSLRGVFDLEDGFTVGPRGQPIIGMGVGAERMVVATRFAAYVLFGYSRGSWNVDLIDGQRGLVGARAIGEANGVVWWWSPLGPCRWEGKVVPLERKVRPRVLEADLDTVFFAHQRTEYEARFHFSLDGGDPNRAICWNYLYDQPREDELGIRVFCGGTVSPGTVLIPGPGGEPVPDPTPTLSPPHDLAVQFVPAGEGGLFALVTWINGETAPGTTTEFWLRVPGGTETMKLLAVPGISSDSPLVLWESTYTVRIRHARGGQFSTFAELTFTTPATSVGTPTAFRVLDRSCIIPVSGTSHGFVQLEWEMGQPGARTEVWRHSSVTDSVLYATTEPDAASFQDSAIGVKGQGHTLFYRIRHVDPLNGKAGPFTNELSILPTWARFC